MAAPTRAKKGRPLTEAERKRLVAAAEGFQSKPPWTAAGGRRNEAFRRLLIRLYEDGVSRPYLVEALPEEWSNERVGLQIHTARAEGLGTGKRRFIPSPPREPKPPVKRALTAAEQRDLMRLFKAIPRNPSGYTYWDTPEGDAVMAQVRALNTDGLSYAALADAMGISRQVLSLHLKATTAPDHTPKTVRTLTARQADKLAAAYDAIPARTSGAVKWDSDEGLVFLRMAEKLRDSGIPPTAIADTVDMSPAVLGRMIGIQDRLTTQVREAKAKAAARAAAKAATPKPRK